MPVSFRCDCPITSAIDVVGDKWLLVLVKQMLIEGHNTFKDFTNSDEAIATNILASKLKLLEELGLVRKTKLPGNRKTNLYYLTECGMSLTPLIVELAHWSDGLLRGLNPQMRESMDLLRRDKAAFTELLEQQYRSQLADLERETGVAFDTSSAGLLQG